MSYSCKRLGDAECNGCECFGLLHWIPSVAGEQRAKENAMSQQRDRKGNWIPKPFFKRRKNTAPRKEQP